MPAKAVTKTATKKKAPAKAAPKISVTKQALPKRKVTIKVHRGSVINGKFQKQTQDYVVEFDNSTTILAALEEIKGKQDGTLTFRRSCRASICGSCGMFINNRTRLACKTKVHDMVDGVAAKNIPPSNIIEIAPQQNQPVVKDLVVDIQPFFEKVERIKPFVQHGAETQKNVDKRSFEQVNMVSNCIMCGCCYSDCTMMTANPNFTGPAALAKAFRFVSDPREGKKTERLKDLSRKDGIWDCVRCGMCMDACPKGVEPMEAIIKLRTRAIAAGVTGNPGARHAIAFKASIKTFGLLNEPLMLLQTMGSSIFGQLGNALNLAKKGKVPNPAPFGHVSNLDEVNRIYQILQRNPIEVETRAEDTGPGAG